MRANWLCGRFCVQASSFENYIAEKPFTDRFVQQSRIKLKNLYNRLKKKIILQKIIMKKKRNKIINSSKALY
ncbi:hypothetical protein CV949_011840 [Acinetobacter baumannii]|nr:hypothetical protein CV949_011840 [Acinetobacter baumannii]